MITKDGLKSIKQIEVAALLGLTERRIQQLYGEGLPRNGEGRGTTHDWYAVLPWHLARISGSKPGQEPVTDRARRERAEADLAEMDRDRKAGVLLDAAQVERIWSEQCANMRAKLLSLPAKVAVRIDDGMSLAVREELLRDAIHEALAELSEGDDA